MRKSVAEPTPIKAHGFILVRNLFAYDGSEISLQSHEGGAGLRDFCRERDPAQHHCWFLQDDFPVFAEEQTGQKSGICGTKST